MEPISEKDLERWAHEELRRLPDCPAPAEVMEGVLRQLKLRQSRPWWQRSLWQWPASVQRMSLTLLGALGLAVVGIGTYLLMALEIPTGPIPGWIQSGQTAWNGFSLRMQGFGGAFGDPGAATWVLAAGIFSAFLCVWVMGIGTAFLQLARLVNQPRLTRNI